MKRTSCTGTGLRRLLALTLFSTVFHIRAEISHLQVPEASTVSTTLISADASAVLRISCLDANSLFISFAVPSGSFDVGTLRVSGREDTRWTADAQAGQRANIAYSVTPRVMVRGLMSRHPRRLIFKEASGAGHAFSTEGLPARLQALPAACR